MKKQNTRFYVIFAIAFLFFLCICTSLFNLLLSIAYDESKSVTKPASFNGQVVTAAAVVALSEI